MAEAVEASVIIAAAGSGERLGAGRPKALAELAGRPLVQWAVEAALGAASTDEVVIAAPPGSESELERLTSELFAPTSGARTSERKVRPGVGVVTGGASRSESVRNALAEASGEIVVVHDAARPLAEPALFDRVVGALQGDAVLDGAITAVPLSDTVKRVGNEGEVIETLDRSELRAIQTPQAFRREALERALESGDLESATDDASLVEAAGGKVAVVEGSLRNLKVTNEQDLRIAAFLLG